MTRRILAAFAVALGLLAIAQPATAAPVTRYPGTVWHDTAGNVIQAHGGGLIKVSSWRSFAPSGTNTCNSHTTWIQPIAGSSTTSYIFMGDRWNSGNLTDSRYIWEPLTVNGTTASIACRDSWTIDTATGVVG
jgi:hypothetical protein